MKSNLNYSIQTLSNSDRSSILQHLLALSSDDRYLRFFSSLSDFAIQNYVEKVLDLSEGRGFGVFDIAANRLIGFAHVSRFEQVGKRLVAELGVSVNEEARGARLSQQLIERVIVHCQANQINSLYMCCLRENKKMQHIARKAGLNVVITGDEASAEVEITRSSMALIKETTYEGISLFDKIHRQNRAFLESILRRPN